MNDDMYKGDLGFYSSQFSVLSMQKLEPFTLDNFVDMPQIMIEFARRTPLPICC